MYCVLCMYIYIYIYTYMYVLLSKYYILYYIIDTYVYIYIYIHTYILSKAAQELTPTPRLLPPGPGLLKAGLPL